MAPARRARRAVTPTTANEAENPYLPSIETQQSFSYGSSTPVLPRQLGTIASANAEDVAATLDAAVRPRVTESAGFSQIEDEARKSPEKQRFTRGRRRAESVLSARESLSPVRETARRLTPDNQLMSTLREASGEPEDQFGAVDPLADAMEGSSISWNTERHLLATEQPHVSRHPASSHSQLQGAAKPSLGWPRPARRVDPPPVPASPSRASSTSVRWPQPSPGAVEFSPRRNSSSQNQIQGPAQRSRATAERIERGIAIGAPVGVLPSSSSSRPEVAAPALRRPTATTRPTFRDDTPDTPQSGHTPASSRHASPSPTMPAGVSLLSRPTGSISHVILLLLLTLIVAFNAYLVRHEIRAVAQSVVQSPISKRPATPIHNYTEAMDKILSTVDRRLTSMTHEIAVLKEEASNRPPSPPPPTDPLVPRRVNFFALGTGALWDDVGDCWCAATTNGKAQLAVQLGRPIVPEEVIIEHIPREATLDPGSAPQTMELWVEYTLLAAGRETTMSAVRRSMLETLAMVYPGEHPSAYSDDLALGPSFFRIGTWRYDINAGHHVQRFPLEAVVDLPGARVSRAVVRATSNWGNQYTCLYRVRLYGRL
ncbi:conserved hypothetical protein [Microsporum canis CBS 113480]|uniref:SUN domain-containing protein n=1 Tax=Arthroderma otae (strain ATCC MYA-4605 / CBS 113480) TaxID=554155 RepID=C5FK80_ARTOC|nr:conserved hypothetical protein [Microsporum canis CBS 113480]EEQ30102.1 conserved hypothetical protein [Microsporum canis CBS 113480]